MTSRNAASMGTYGSTWEAGGYCGIGPVASLIDSLQGRPALVLGGAEGVFDEAEAAEQILGEHPVIFAANDVGMFIDRLDHWVSLHVDHLGVWKSVRWLHARAQEDTQYHSVDSRPFINHNWQNLTPLFALSGYFAMQIAWIMGANPIVLCGCPGEFKRKFFEVRSRSEFGYGSGTAGSDGTVREQITHEMKRLPEFKTRVRSMSGWTKQFFGGL